MALYGSTDCTGNMLGEIGSNFSPQIGEHYFSPTAIYDQPLSIGRRMSTEYSSLFTTKCVLKAWDDAHQGLIGPGPVEYLAIAANDGLDDCVDITGLGGVGAIEATIL